MTSQDLAGRVLRPPAVLSPHGGLRGRPRHRPPARGRVADSRRQHHHPRHRQPRGHLYTQPDRGGPETSLPRHERLYCSTAGDGG